MLSYNLVREPLQSGVTWAKTGRVADTLGGDRVPGGGTIACRIPKMGASRTFVNQKGSDRSWNRGDWGDGSRGVMPATNGLRFLVFFSFRIFFFYSE